MRYYNPKTHEAIETDLSLPEAAECLRERRPAAGSFPASLLGHYDSGRALSEAQAYWLARLATEGPRKEVGVEGFDGTAIVGLLTRAREAGLKYPKIRYRLDDGRRVVFSLAGPRSKYAGDAMISDGGPFGASTWYGRITCESGTWLPSRSVDEEVREAIEAVAHDPVHAGATCGRLTGSCCFCGRELTTKESVGVGYGPICASKWGLPWGSRAEYEVRKEEVFEQVRA